MPAFDHMCCNVTDITLYHCSTLWLCVVSDAWAAAEASFHPGLHRSLADRLGQCFPCLRSAVCCASYPSSTCMCVTVCVCVCERRRPRYCVNAAITVIETKCHISQSRMFVLRILSGGKLARMKSWQSRELVFTQSPPSDSLHFHIKVRSAF